MKKMTKKELKQIIKEEIEKLLEEESGFLSNIYKLCSEGEKCEPESKKTKWWKGR
tara:strand:- start:365 stop:529 length:165 start_codon:yes stop_codon:yes gene_type:complete